MSDLTSGKAAHSAVRMVTSGTIGRFFELRVGSQSGAFKLGPSSNRLSRCTEGCEPFSGPNYLIPRKNQGFYYSCHIVSCKKGDQFRLKPSHARVSWPIRERKFLSRRAHSQLAPTNLQKDL